MRGSAIGLSATALTSILSAGDGGYPSRAAFRRRLNIPQVYLHCSPPSQRLKPISQPKPFLDVLAGRRQNVPPVWMMRQAGRYLPEYRELRAKAGTFLDLCFTPELAAEVTLQPVRRFGFDAAILFSDILVVPHALGREVRFVAGEGPRLDPLDTAEKVRTLRRAEDETVFAPVYETVRRVKAALPDGVTLLGFCGAPWTVAT